MKDTSNCFCKNPTQKYGSSNKILPIFILACFYLNLYLGQRQTQPDSKENIGKI